MKIGSLCTGYGGLDMAVEAYFNAETVWCAEIDKYASSLIKERFTFINHGDIKAINWDEVEPIDILTAGYPCQPFSHAGLRKGTDDDRHLWPHIRNAIGTLKPKYIILENVRGHLSLGFKEVLYDLATLGYDASWRVVRASDVGAPHQRARLFIVAYPEGKRPGRQACKIQGQGTEFRGDISTLADSDSNACTQPRRANRGISSQGDEIVNRSNRQVHWLSDPITDREVPSPLDQDGRINPEFVEYMMGLPKGWVTYSNLSRTQQLKMLGNGVVPQQAHHAISLIMETVNNL